MGYLCVYLVRDLKTKLYVDRISFQIMIFKCIQFFVLKKKQNNRGYVPKLSLFIVKLIAGCIAFLCI